MAAGFKQATVNASSVPATQTNFPAYVDLSRIGITTLAEAQSVRVYSDSGKTTELAREIVSATEMHVKVPSLTSTFVLYVDYDGVRSDYAATDTYGRNNVWSGERAVYHLEGLTDSTSTGTTLTNVNTVAFSSSKIGNGSDTGSANTNKHLHSGTTELVDSTQLTSGWSARGFVTFNTLPATSDADSRWVFLLDVLISGSTRRTVNFQYDGRTTNQGFKLRVDGSSFNTYNSNTTTTVNTPVYFALQYTGTNLELYINNSLVINQAHTFTTRSATPSSKRLQMHGVDTYAAGHSSSKIDEFRVKNSGSNTANWLTTEYNNLMNESTFWGTWSDVSVGGAFVPQVMMM